MGVTGLWTVVKPCARPIKLETLNRRRLAVDASIWIYQFLKAVRDKEGNALRNSHVVGFFRRICKLLFHGIKPVFVFDGGAPALKRETISARHKRREGRREDAVRTAGRLLAVQMQRLAEEEDEKRSRERRKAAQQHVVEEEAVPENPVYVDELMMPAEERKKSRPFKRQDQYHLPELDTSLEQMGAPNDPRIMSQEELEEYARQFNAGEDINLYDFSKIDFDSAFFQSLPPSDRYNILSAARLRSRLRMGYSKEQLDSMFPNRMEFSRFQIDRVRERNELTQRLMNINGMTDDSAISSTRIAGERGREYVLVKSDDVEGGWVLGVLSNQDEGKREKPIDVDTYNQHELEITFNEDVDEDEDEEFEDVPIEGLNRFPQLPYRKADPGGQLSAQYQREQRPEAEADDSLFVGADVDALFEEPGLPQDEADEDLQRAIQMSLEQPPAEQEPIPTWSTASATKAQAPLPAGKQDTNVFEPVEEEEEDEGDLFAALTKAKAPAAPHEPAKPPTHPFGGPLPFESLKFNYQKKPTKPAVDEEAGGFDKTTATEQEKEGDEKKAAMPLPPWFEQKSQHDTFIDEEKDDQYSGLNKYKPSTNIDEEAVLQKERPAQVINLDDEEETQEVKNEVINLESEDEVQETPAQQPVTQPVVPRVTPPKPEDVVIPAKEEPAANQASTSPRLAADQNRQEAPSVKAQASPKSKSSSPEFEDVELATPHPAELDITAGELVGPSPKIKMAEASESAPTAVEASDIPQSTVDPTVAEARYPQYDDYSDPEDVELMAQLAEEAEEHARFASTLNAKPQFENVMDYEKELKQLRSQQAKDRRDADEVSQIMIQECQQLLRLFGIPYITAPMEAEAQCAELVELGLVDGIITDDSDVFLFGGTKVYKNMFNQAKYVELYQASDLEIEYGLDRRKLIRFAHLLGSDYTEGIPGVGPVTALEILTEFDTLEDFRDWWTLVQRGAKLPDDAHSAFRKKFKKNISKLFLPPNFPDTRVDAAYLNPEVDDDRSGFQWGVPDLPSLRAFLMSTVGWSPQRTDEVLVPVIRDMNKREQEGTQANITNFFQGQLGVGVFAPRRKGVENSRMQKAFGRLKAQRETGEGEPRSPTPIESHRPESRHSHQGEIEVSSLQDKETGKRDAIGTKVSSKSANISSHQTSRKRATDTDVKDSIDQSASRSKRKKRSA